MIGFRFLPPAERVVIAPLLQSYAGEMRPLLRGSEPADGHAAAAMLCADPRTEVLLCERDGAPAGFAILFDLPEVVFARRCGMLDDLYVHPEHRRRGIARAMLDHLAGEGRRRRWSHLRWIVPAGDQDAIRLYEQVAERAGWLSFVIRLDAEASL
ncbi:GNAT family N-acetyltransferase [Roseomonas elaeocarpi]|uniref:GNAT family N-acetyltransferase n=1 Tax=Roseomonas elaeocarpi TaxID=907779 RepID=A0ABV6JT74_9PROT